MPTTPMSPPYDKVEQAFQHFKADELARGYQPWDERREGDWALVYFPTSQFIALFPTLESVSEWYNWSIYRNGVYLSAKELNAANTTQALQGLYSKLQPEATEFPAGLDLATKCWELCQAKAPRRPRVRAKLSKSEVKQKYVVNLQKLLSPEGQAAISGLPKQARVVAQGFADAAQTIYTEEELGSFSRQLLISGKLKTKQDPYRIVMYYAPNLSDLGLLEYPGRRKSAEPEEEGPQVDPEEVSDFM